MNYKYRLICHRFDALFDGERREVPVEDGGPGKIYSFHPPSVLPITNWERHLQAQNFYDMALNLWIFIDELETLGFTRCRHENDKWSEALIHIDSALVKRLIGSTQLLELVMETFQMAMLVLPPPLLEQVLKSSC